jgi:hypothetical protein
MSETENDDRDDEVDLDDEPSPDEPWAKTSSGDADEL